MEKVMVVPTARLERFIIGDDFIVAGMDEIISCIMNHHTYIDRTYAETADEYKQIIPYAVLMNDEKTFLTKRLPKQTEKRLHGLYSIGLGGHINPTEERSDNVVIAGMRRELREEVGLDEIVRSKCVGIINDHTAEVSNYHIGLVFPLRISEQIEVREPAKMTGRWATDREIAQHFHEMESWSKITWEHRNIWRG